VLLGRSDGGQYQEATIENYQEAGATGSSRWKGRSQELGREGAIMARNWQREGAMSTLIEVKSDGKI
jgi:hypothetical protein